MSALERLKSLFCELFQLDVADLDFGIYRLLHLKRKEVEGFLSTDLPAAVNKEFKAAASAEQASLEKDLKELADRIRQDIGPDALQLNGEPAPIYANAKLVRDYAAKRKQLEAIEATEAQKAEVFNHLYTFFRRYYDEGDFIPRRFYGSRESYAVPYNGEEVLFHWANKDQHYVKTGEVFRDYTFKIETVLGTFTVRFKLAQATTAKDNTKGDVRFFFALPKDAEYDKAAKAFVVPFEYRLPTEAEVQRYGSGAKGQDALTLEAAKKILAAVPDETMKGELAKVVDVKNPDDTAKREEVKLLLKRLRHFTRKNTTDYFIHKNLGGFLRQELEFYIKDQVVQAADMEGDFEAKRRMLRVFRALAEQIITFLHQIEDAQRRLFEKKKFVLRTDYLVPIQHLPRALWSTVLANRRQLAEWKALYALVPKSDLFNFKGQVNERVLEEHPTLVVDTRHFSPEFANRLLEAAGDLDEQTDGVLFGSENFQALSFLEARHRENIDSIYIDPPYNTDASPIAYKNGYRDASWLALVDGRVALARPTMTEGAVMCVTIDDTEVHNLRTLLGGLLSGYELLGVVAIKNNPAGRTGTVGFSICHEYALFYGRPGIARVGRLEHSEAQKARYKEHDDTSAFEWTNFRKHGGLNTYRTARPRQFYPIYVQGQSIRIPEMEWDNASREWNVLEDAAPEEEVLLPIDEAGRERIWDFVVDTAREQLAHLMVRKDSRGATAIYRKWRLHDEGLLPQTVWDKSQYSAAEYGTNLLANMFGETHKFTFPKSVHAVVDCLRVANLRSTMDGTVLDFFAGSGTTGHAVINLNRVDGGQRKFILVEMGGYFDTVLVPRLKKAMFTPDWKDGKPKRFATKEEAERTPRLVKVLRLESYEDALHNVAEAEACSRAAKKAEAVRATAGEERYRLNYLVKLPLDASDTMLNVEKLEHPLGYTIEVLTDDGPREQTVDLVETFNWLYGLRVKRLLTWEAKQGKEAREYRVVVATDRDARRRILVVWRDMTNLDSKAERAFLVAEVAKLGDFEEKWINGDCAVPGFASLDGLFKRLMEHEA